MDTITTMEQPEYTLPGIMNYLQSEFTQIEKMKITTRLETLEMKFKIAKLEGIKNLLTIANNKLASENASLKRDNLKLLNIISELRGSPSVDKLKSSKLDSELAQIIESLSPSNVALLKEDLSEEVNLTPLVTLRRFLQDCMKEMFYLIKNGTGGIVNGVGDFSFDSKDTEVGPFGVMEGLGHPSKEEPILSPKPIPTVQPTERSREAPLEPQQNQFTLLLQSPDLAASDGYFDDTDGETIKDDVSEAGSEYENEQGVRVSGTIEPLKRIQAGEVSIFEVRPGSDDVLVCENGSVYCTQLGNDKLEGSSSIKGAPKQALWLGSDEFALFFDNEPCIVRLYKKGGQEIAKINVIDALKAQEIQESDGEEEDTLLPLRDLTIIGIDVDPNQKRLLAVCTKFYYIYDIQDVSEPTLTHFGLFSAPRDAFSAVKKGLFVGNDIVLLSRNGILKRVELKSSNRALETVIFTAKDMGRGLRLNGFSVVHEKGKKVEDSIVLIFESFSRLQHVYRPFDMKTEALGPEKVIVGETLSGKSPKEIATLRTKFWADQEACALRKDGHVYILDRTFREDLQLLLVEFDKEEGAIVKVEGEPGKAGVELAIGWGRNDEVYIGGDGVSVLDIGEGALEGPHEKEEKELRETVKEKKQEEDPGKEN